MNKTEKESKREKGMAVKAQKSPERLLTHWLVCQPLAHIFIEYYFPLFLVQGMYQTVKPLSPAPSTELGLNHMTLGALGNQNIYPPIAPPSQQRRDGGAGDYQSQQHAYQSFYQNKNATNYAALNNNKMLQSATHMQHAGNQLFDSSKLTGGPSSMNYTGIVTFQSSLLNRCHY